MKEIRLAVKMIMTLIKDRMHYPGRLFADTIMIISRWGILMMLYWYVFQVNGGAISGLSFPIVAWSTFIYFVFLTLNLRNVARVIMQDIKTGNVEVLFSKPVSYILYRVWWQIGSGAYSFLVAGIVGTVVLSLTVGLPETMKILIFIPSFLLVFLGAMILTIFIYAIIGLMAFWIEEVSPIFWIVDKIVMILGGSYVPVAMFPDYIKKIAIYSPFGASQFITHSVYETWQNDWYILLIYQLFWIIILGTVLYVVLVRATRQLSINGG